MKRAHKILSFNTIAFTVCFAAWMLNGVLVTFLVDNGEFDWSSVEIGWLLGIPVLTGSLFRLPLGILTDKHGGRLVFGVLLLACAVPMYLLSSADSFLSFAWMSVGFGFCGTSFAVGIAYTSVWFEKQQQGTALGIFGAGNAGAAITTLFAPSLLNYLTDHGTRIEGWRTLPKIYAVSLLVMGVLFLLFTEKKIPPGQAKKSLGQRLTPLKDMRVWRFGLYYFLVFGCFVAFSQWLVPYFVNVYQLSLVTAGIFAALFSFPSGVIRALGGWLSDKWGARTIMYWVLGSSVVISLLLTVPRMEIYSPGAGVMAKKAGTVTEISAALMVDGKKYTLKPKPDGLNRSDQNLLIWPTKETWQEPLVKVGDSVSKKQLLARGQTRIYFQANVWIYAILVVFMGSIWGIGKAAVYKHIPDYFPTEVGVVGGLVGVLGGLGGFFCPVIFGYLLKFTGLWTSCWMFMLLLSFVCLLWMHKVVVGMMKRKAPAFAREIEDTEPS